jgi:hypothetical protein
VLARLVGALRLSGRGLGLLGREVVGSRRGEGDSLVGGHYAPSSSL